MIRLHLLALSIALVCGPALAGSGHELKPKHGGWVQEVKDVTFELVVRDGKLVLHLDDHGKPIATQGATGRVTVLQGTDRRDVALAPAGENRMAAQEPMTLAAGAKLVTVVTLPGKAAMTARFTAK